MKLALTEDQALIRATAERVLAEASTSAAVRRAMDSAAGYDADLWRRIGAELGWCALALPEAQGGLGLSAFEQVLLLEQMGRRLACLPYFATVCLAGQLLAQAGREAARARWLPPIAAGQLRATASFEAPLVARRAGDGWQVSGRIAQVLDGASADTVFALARIEGEGAPALFAVPADAPGLRRTALQTWDLTRRYAALVFEDVTLDAAARVDDPARLAEGLRRAQAYARLSLAAEQLGGAQACLELTLAYTQNRKQFGRAIASFQAVKHRCAEMMVRSRPRARWSMAPPPAPPPARRPPRWPANATRPRRWPAIPISGAPARRSSSTVAWVSPGTTIRSCTSSARTPAATGWARRSGCARRSRRTSWSQRHERGRGERRSRFPRRSGGLDASASGRPLREAAPSRRAGRRGFRAGAAQGMGARARPRRLDRSRLAKSLRRARTVPRAAGDLPRGIRARRRAGPHGSHRRNPARSHADRLRQRGAEAAFPAAHPRRQRVLGAGLFRAECRVRSRQRADALPARRSARRVDRGRAEGVDFAGARVGLDLRARPLRAGIEGQQGPRLPARAAQAAGREHPAHPPVDR